MPDDYVIPNFQNKTVQYASQQAAAHNVGLKVKTADSTWHDPTGAEMEKVIASNGPNSQPGTIKPNGEWVGVEIGPI